MVSEEPVVLPDGESEYKLPTAKAGDFRMEIMDAESGVRCAVPSTSSARATKTQSSNAKRNSRSACQKAK